MAEETTQEQDVIDAGAGDPLGLEKAYVKKVGASSADDPLGLEAALKKKVDESQSQNPKQAQSQLPDAGASQSASAPDDGSSLLEHGNAALASIAKGQTPADMQPVQAPAPEKPTPSYSPFAIAGAFNEGLSSVTDAAGLIVRPIDKLIDAVTPGADASKVNQYDVGYLFNWASNFLKGTAQQAPLPDTFGGKVVGGIAQTIPAVIGAAATGGASAEGQAFAGVGDAAAGYLTKSQIVQNALTKAAGPLTKYLAVTKAGQAGTEAYDKSGGAFLPTLLGTLQGAQTGLESGIGLEGQMSAGEQIGGKLFKLALKAGVVNEDGIVTQQALKSLVGSPFAFAASSVAEDLANGRPIDWQNAGVSAATALPFEAQHVAGAFSDAAALSDAKDKLNEQIQQVSSNADANAIANFATASPGDIRAAIARPETADELQILALGKGIQAQDAPTLNEKNSLHLAQLELQKQADIKSIGQQVQTNGILGFVKAATETDLPDPLKEKLLANATIAHTAVNPNVDIDERITANLKDGVEHAQDHIDRLTTVNPNIAADGQPQEINALIDMVDSRTDAQEKLLDHTENENKAPAIEVDPYESELEKLGYPKEEIAGMPEDQKQHIINKNIPNEQRIISKENEASAAEPANGGGVPIEPNDESATENTAGANENLQGDANAVPPSTTGASHNTLEANGASSEPLGHPFTYQSRDHGLIDIQGLTNGKYRAKFTDGTSDDFTRAEMQDFFGIEPERFDKAEKDNRLYATDHPEHVAQLYLDKLTELHETGNPQAAIAEYGPRTNAKDFAQVNDANNITGPIRMNYFKNKGEKGIDLHLQADEINRLYFNGNPVIHAEDIANFMIDHPNGERSFYTPSGNAELKEISDRYFDLTGKKLFKTTAEKILAEAEKKAPTGDEELHGEINRKLVEDVLDKEFNFEPDGISVSDWMDKMRSQFEEYLKDPDEAFNIFHPVFDGMRLDEDQIRKVHEFFTERQNGQIPGGRSDDNVAEQPEGAGVGAENAATPAEGAGEPQAAEVADRSKATQGGADHKPAEEPIDDDVPFQKSRGDQLPEEKVKLASALLEKTFPGIETNFHDNVESFEQAMRDNGIETSGDNLPNAFVGKDGVIHFNPEKINGDTQLHEYGHILTAWAEKFAPKLYEKIQRIGKDATGVHQELKDNGYFLSGKRLYDEAFVTMLGREGAGRLDEVIDNGGKRGVIKTFINDLWNKFQRYLLEKTGFDISKFKNIKNMGVGEFLNTINSKYLLSGTEISDIKSKDIGADNELQLKKPERSPGETMAEYARRLGEWKRDLYNNPAGRTRNELNRVLRPVREKLAELNRAFAEGVKKAKDATKTAFLEYDAFRKSKQNDKLSDLRDRWKEKLKAEKNASAEKLQDYKDATKTAFLEYDAAKKGQTRERLTELRQLYQQKLAEEHQLRLDQNTKLRTEFGNIRNQINGILGDLHKSNALGGVKFSERDVIAFANQVNKVTTEKGLDRFREFVVRATQSVDYLRDLAENKKQIKDAKALLNKDYVPANIKSLIRELTSLNPNRVENPKMLKAYLQDINESQRAKQAPMAPEHEINDYINRERDFDVRARSAEAQDDRNNIEESPEHAAVAEQVGSTLPESYDLHRELEKIVRNEDLTHNERVKKINQISDALAEYYKGVKKAIDPVTNEVMGKPEDYEKILEDIRTGSSGADKESLRGNLEEMAKAKQDSIDTSDPDLSPEQKESLETLKNVPLDGEDADTLRLYNNVLENVLLNDTHDGIGKFEAKALGNGDDGALKVVNYLNDTGRKTRDADFNVFGSARRAAIDLSVMLSRIANGDNTFLTKLTTGTYFDQIKNGFTKGKQQFHDLFSSPLEKVFKENKDLAKNADSAHRLTLYSYINQFREFASETQKDLELQKRIKTIYKDIFIKSTEGLQRDKDEAIREQRVWNEFENKIKDKTGLDISKSEELRQLTRADMQDIEFLNPAERLAYDTIRKADDTLRPEHEQIVKRQLIQPYETWENHMRDSYRLLGTGLTDVVAGDDLGFNVTNKADDDASGASIQRVKGDPLAQKDAAHQRVINMNFFDNQSQHIKDMLYDINTLKNRQIFDAALKNKELRDALGNENHQLYKDSIKAFVLSEMGMNNSMGDKELKLVNQGLNIIAKVGTARQLFSLLAHPKHYFSNLFNTIATIGIDSPKLLAQSAHVMHDAAVKELIGKHPISERADNLASLNMTSMEGRDNGESPETKGWGRAVLNHTEDFLNKYLLGINTDGTVKERLISQPIKLGDTKSAEWSWIAYYAKQMIDSGAAKNFDDIDWVKENANPNREAAAYAENMTSKQLNENTKASRSKLLSSKNTAFVAGKYLLFPFGSRNMHNLQTMVENFRTLAARDTIVDDDYRKNQAASAAKSMLGIFAQEAIFQGIRLGGTLGFAYTVKQGLTYLLASYFASQQEKKQLMDKIDQGIQKAKDNFLHQWYSETIGGAMFSGLGNTPQQYILRGVNKLTNTDLFYEPDISINQQVQDANNFGMIGSAFTGLGDQAKDVYRLIDDKDKYGVPVQLTPYQKSVFAVSLLSNTLAISGMNDANLNRSIEAMRKQVEFNVASKFHEPNYEDLSAPSPLKIGAKVVQLSAEHQQYYQQMKESYQAEFMAKGVNSKAAETMASRIAKGKLLGKFGYDTVIKSGDVKGVKK
jgi:hypothetical protein